MNQINLIVILGKLTIQLYLTLFKHECSMIVKASYLGYLRYFGGRLVAVHFF